MCSLSRYVVVGGLTGVAAATLSGSDHVGALVAAGAVGLTALALRRWPALAGSCALPADSSAAPVDEGVAEPVAGRDPEVATRA